MTFEKVLDKLEYITDHNQEEELVRELAYLTERTKTHGDIGPLSSALPSLKELQVIWEVRTKTYQRKQILVKHNMRKFLLYKKQELLGKGKAPW